MATIVLDTVYKTLLTDTQYTESRGLNPTIIIDSGVLNVYVSNNATDNPPANKAAMEIDSQQIDFANNASQITGMARWILFEQASGTTTSIETFGVVAREDV